MRVTAPIPAGPVGAADRSLAGYVRRTVYPYSAFYQGVLDRAGIGGRVRGRAELGRIPPTDLTRVPDPGQLVLRPDLAAIVRRGRRGLAVRAVSAKVSGGMHGFNRRVIEHRFKPVLWVLADGLPLGYSTADMLRLGAKGTSWLGRAGVTDRDVLVSVLAPGPTVAHWQLVLGCRRARVSAAHLEPLADPALVARLGPSTLAGDPQHLVALLTAVREAGLRLPNLRTVLAVGDPLGSDMRERIRSLGSGAAVVGAWAPPGVRSLWSECREGAQRPEPTGYHAWDDDVLELAPGGDDAAAGELLWTGVGWHGSALLRLRTFATATLARERCPACRHAGPRIVPLAPVPRSSAPVAAAAPPLAPPLPVPAAAEQQTGPGDAPTTGAVPVVAAGAEAVLDAEADVAAWQVEYRSVDGTEETIVLVAPAWGAALVPLVRRLDRHLGATQFVVLSAEEIAARVDAAGGRIVDRRGSAG